MVGCSYLLSQGSTLVLCRVARRAVGTGLSRHLKDVQEDSIASRVTRADSLKREIWTDPLGLRLHKHILRFCLKGRETDWLPEMAGVGGVGPTICDPKKVPFQHPAHSTNTQTRGIENILNTVVLPHDTSKDYARGEHTRFFWILL
ncbi:unnamed protein product [Penicillium viridicatum]